MASALRFAARKVCGRAFQRSAQPYFTAAVKEERRRLFQSISHGGSSVRRFCSSESPNLVNANKPAPNSVAGAALTESASPSIRLSRKKFYSVWGYTMTVIATCYAVVYVENRLMYGPPFWSKEQPSNTSEWKEQPDNAGRMPYPLEKAE